MHWGRIGLVVETWLIRHRSVLPWVERQMLPGPFVRGVVHSLLEVLLWFAIARVMRSWLGVRLRLSVGGAVRGRPGMWLRFSVTGVMRGRQWMRLRLHRVLLWMV